MQKSFFFCSTAALIINTSFAVVLFSEPGNIAAENLFHLRRAVANKRKPLFLDFIQLQTAVENYKSNNTIFAIHY